MSHWHDSRCASQNVGNHLGNRSCVRQSRLYREYESGNATKALLGQDSLIWETKKKQGAYAGHSVYDHTTDRYSRASEKDMKMIEKKNRETESKSHYFGEQKKHFHCSSSSQMHKAMNNNMKESAHYRLQKQQQQQHQQQYNKKESLQQFTSSKSSPHSQKQEFLPSTREGKQTFSYNHNPSTSHADEFSSSRDAYMKNRNRDSISSMGLIG